MFKNLLIILLSLILTACSLCETKVYVDVPYEVKVPVKCTVELPDGEFPNGINESAKYIFILEYISKLHKNIEVCK
jgi:hypothetical protein